MYIDIKYQQKTFTMHDKYPDDLMVRIWEKTRTFYELNLLEKVQKIHRPGVFLDIGANIGNHSVFFMNFCKCTKLFAIEACADTAEVLNNNISANNFKRIDYEIIVKAISGNSGNVTMSNVNKGNTGLTRIVDSENGDTISATIDELFGDLNDISVIKMDIEGFEYESIQKSEKVLSKCHPMIIAELHHSRNVYFDDMDKFLKKFGYTSDKINYASSPTYIWV